MYDGKYNSNVQVQRWARNYLMRNLPLRSLLSVAFKTQVMSETSVDDAKAKALSSRAGLKFLIKSGRHNQKDDYKTQ